MASLFCCVSIIPYRPSYLLHQSKFDEFMKWASFPKTAALATEAGIKVDLNDLKPDYVVQLVRQVNYGPLEGKRYFAHVGGEDVFIEVTEDDLIQENFQKLNSYKNFKCNPHNKFYEVNLYQKDPVNKFHWRANIARPAGDIDL